MHAHGWQLRVGQALADAVPIDPYLLWAQQTDWDGFGGPPETLPIALELLPGQTGSDLQAAAWRANFVGQEFVLPPIYADQRFVTAQVSHRFVEAWQRGGLLRECVARIELGLPVLSRGRVGDPEARLFDHGDRPLLGVIDHGFAFAGPDFVRGLVGARKTRIRTIWDQEAKKPAFSPVVGLQPGVPPVVPPPAFGFGRELRLDQIDALLSNHLGNEAGCYEAAHYLPLRHAATHGTHVVSLAAGRLPPSHRLRYGVDRVRPPAPDTASDVDLALVQLPRDAVLDSSGRWLAVHVVDGLHHILSVAGSGQHVVVNLSYGARTGPHDGTGLTEQAMIDLIAQRTMSDRRRLLDIVLAAGNAFDQRAHAQLAVKPSAPAQLRWQVAAGSEAWTFCELWLPGGIDPAQVAVTLAPPPENQGPTLQAQGGVMSLLVDGSGRVVAALIFPKKTSLGLNGTCALLAIAPTWRRGAGSRAPAGRWAIGAEWRGAAGAAAFDVHAYLARNDADFGMPLRGRPSHFVGGAGYDEGRHMRRARDDDDSWTPKPPVRRLGTLCWNAQVDGLHIVAGYVDRPYAPVGLADAVRMHPGYSSAGPARGGARGGPDVAMPSDASPLSAGVRAAGTRGAATVRLVGTSTAAPAWARVLLNTLLFPPGPLKVPVSGPRDVPFFGNNVQKAP